MATETSRLPAESNVADPLGPLPRRVLVYIAWVAVCCLALLHPVTAFISYSLSNDNASHLILIPAISAWILFLERGKIFKFLGSDSKIAAVFLFAGVAVALFALTLASSWSSLNRLSIYIFALVLLWIAGFAFIFGRTAFSNAQFPLAFLLLTIPIPDYFLDKAIYFLQKGSTEISAILFDWSGVPVLRDGFVFHLAHVNIEVARECSGIRSSLALLILAILVAHFYLETFWKQVMLVLAGLAMMIVKNGVRIVTLTLLASYVDPGFLYGRLHHEGGVVFFLLGLALLAPVLWLLERSEPKRTAPRAS